MVTYCWSTDVLFTSSSPSISKGALRFKCNKKLHKCSITSCMMLCQNLVKSALSMMFRPCSCVSKQSQCQETCSERTDGGGEVGMQHNAHWYQTVQKSAINRAVSELSHVVYWRLHYITTWFHTLRISDLPKKEENEHALMRTMGR